MSLAAKLPMSWNAGSLVVLVLAQEMSRVALRATATAAVTPYNGIKMFSSPVTSVVVVAIFVNTSTHSDNKAELCQNVCFVLNVIS